MNNLFKIVMAFFTVISFNLQAANLPTSLFHRTATVTLKAGEEARYAKALVDFEVMKSTRQEKGNVSYVAYQNTADERQVVFNELWKDKAASEAHLKTPHMVAFFTAINFNPAFYDISAEGDNIIFTVKSDFHDYVIEILVLEGFEAKVLK